VVTGWGAEGGSGCRKQKWAGGLKGRRSSGNAGTFQNVEKQEIAPSVFPAPIGLSQAHLPRLTCLRLGVCQELPGSLHTCSLPNTVPGLQDGHNPGGKLRLG
jgi:hypothetical protein